MKQGGVDVDSLRWSREVGIWAVWVGAGRWGSGWSALEQGGGDLGSLGGSGGVGGVDFRHHINSTERTEKRC